MEPLRLAGILRRGPPALGTPSPVWLLISVNLDNGKLVLGLDSTFRLSDKQGTQRNAHTRKKQLQNLAVTAPQRIARYVTSPSFPLRSISALLLSARRLRFWTIFNRRLDCQWSTSGFSLSSLPLLAASRPARASAITTANSVRHL